MVEALAGNRARKARRLALNLVIAALSILFALMTGEVALRFAAHRLLGSGEVIAAGEVFRFDDDLLGFRLDPGSTRVHARGAAYVVRDRINSLGMRDVEHSLERLPGTARVLILGDSFMYGTGVPMEAVMARRLEGLLGGTEVINAGVHSYGLSHHYLYYTHRGHALDPDLVLLAFFINDIEKPEGLRVVLGEDGLPVSIAKTAETLAKLEGKRAVGIRGSISAWLRMRSLLYVLVRKRLDDIRSKAREASVKDLQPGEGDDQDAGVSYAPAFYTSPEGLEGADWPLALRTLSALKARVEEDGARFAVVLVPAPFQLSDEAFEVWAEWAQAPAGALSRTHPQDQVARWCAASHTPCLDLLPVFEGGNRIHLFLSHDYHWTEAGHRLGAGAVRDFILENELLPPHP